jgi:hypothetical protein
MEKSENMLRYEKAYDDCRDILGGNKHLDAFSLRPSVSPTNEQLEKFNDYLYAHINEEDSGMLRTLLIIGKPFKNNPIVKDNLEILTNRLRARSKTGFI